LELIYFAIFVVRVAASSNAKERRWLLLLFVRRAGANWSGVDGILVALGSRRRPASRPSTATLS